MVDIDKIKDEIIEALKPLNPDKIILFGSYAYGEPNEDSDIDLYIIKDDLDDKNIRNFNRKARMRIVDLIKKYRVAFDILSSSSKYLKRDDWFYKKDILEKGKVLYE